MFKRKSENLFEPPGIAESMTELRIVLPDYRIDKCGKEFLNFKRLRDLYTQTNVGSESLLPMEVGSIASLEKLTILNFHYSEFPKWVLKLTNLKQLTIRGNDIRSIPADIHKLNSLQRLRVENCLIDDLPESIVQLNELKQLSLSNNQYLKRVNTAFLPKSLDVLNLTMTQVNNEYLSEISERLPSLALNKFVN